MKPSKYNLYIPQNGDEYIVYNTLSGAIIILDQDAKDCIHKNNIDRIDPNSVQKLKECNIIVEDNVDERKIFSYNYYLNKFASKTVRFLVLTTFECNLQCPYCYQRANINARNSMNTTTADNLVRFIQNVVLEQNYTKLILGLYGGEPLLNLECCYRIISQLRSWCETNNVHIDVILTTNGTLLSEGILNELSPLNAVHLTIDGPKNIHDKKRFLHSGAGTYDKVISALDMLKNKKINTNIRINIARDNLSALPLILKDLSDHGLINGEKNRIYTSFIDVPCNTGYNDRDFLCISEDEIDYAEDNLWCLGREWGLDLGNRSIGPCSFLNDWTFTIDPLGNIYRCPLWAGSEEYCVGSIENSGCVNSNYAYYDQMTYDPCQIPECVDCIFLPRCGGGCPINAQEHNIDSHSNACKIFDKVERSVQREVKRRVMVK